MSVQTLSRSDCLFPKLHSVVCDHESLDEKLVIGLMVEDVSKVVGKSSLKNSVYKSAVKLSPLYLPSRLLPISHRACDVNACVV